MNTSLNDLLAQAIHAHGGMAQWQQLRHVTAHIGVGGAIWQLKGWPDVLADAHVAVDTRRVHAEYWPLMEPGQKALFEPARTAILTADGKVLDSRDAPREAFAGHKITTPWDAQNLIYFAGNAMWTYLNAPFVFTQPGFKTEEVAPWQEGSEVWRGLKVTFPPEVPSHSTEQTFYFDESGLLRRHDYSVDIMGGTSSAHYATDHQRFGGIVFPTRRRVYSKAPDGKPILDRVAVAIDFKHIEVA